MNGWLVLTHHIPPSPPYLRAKALRRLSRMGALPLKRSTYVLPAGDARLEDFEWLRREIRDGGGDAWVVEGRFVGDPDDAELQERFRALRAADFRGLAADARALLKRMGGKGADEPGWEAERRRLARRVEAVRRIDFFGADGRDDVEALMSNLDRTSASDSTRGRPEAGTLRARTWATRAGVKVDRMASAWLIKRFIDPEATFVFVPPGSPPPAPDVVRFDMFEGGFTHEGDRCTFEVLLDVARRRDDRALRALAEIVHDLDLHDERHRRPETAGVAALISGIVARHASDEQRLAEGSQMFESLYASLGRAAGR